MSHLPKFLFVITIIGGALALSLFLSGKEINSLSSSILAPGATAIPTTLVPTGTMSPDVTESPMTTTEDPDWYTGPWSSCIAGKRTRIVECRSGNTVISETLCSTPRPKDQEIYSVSGPASVSFQEASGPATYKITLSGPSDSDAKIISVKATSEPKHTTAINYKHPADGSGKGVPWMTWTTQNISSNGQSAVIRSDDYAWYGIPGDDGSMPDNLPPGIVGLSPQNFQYPKLGHRSDSQSLYAIHLNMTLNIGCQLSQNFDMKVLYEKDTVSESLTTLKIKNKKAIKTTLRPFMSLIYTNSIYRACVSASDVEMFYQTNNTVNMKGQYKTAVADEEAFHARQARGEVDWNHGGNPGLIDVIRDIFVGTAYCEYGTSPDIAIKQANSQFEHIVSKVLTYFNWSTPGVFGSDKLRGERAALIGCWTEKTAKEYAGLTPEKYGGSILEHAYPGCKQDIQQPESLADILRSEIDYFRGYVKSFQ